MLVAIVHNGARCLCAVACQRWFKCRNVTFQLLAHAPDRHELCFAAIFNGSKFLCQSIQVSLVMLQAQGERGARL